jgi:hypothetical protein
VVILENVDGVIVSLKSINAMGNNIFEEHKCGIKLQL